MNLFIFNMLKKIQKNSPRKDPLLEKIAFALHLRICVEIFFSLCSFCTVG